MSQYYTYTNLYTNRHSTSRVNTTFALFSSPNHPPVTTRSQHTTSAYKDHKEHMCSLAWACHEFCTCTSVLSCSLFYFSFTLLFYFAHFQIFLSHFGFISLTFISLIFLCAYTSFLLRPNLGRILVFSSVLKRKRKKKGFILVLRTPFFVNFIGF